MCARFAKPGAMRGIRATPLDENTRGTLSGNTPRKYFDHPTTR